MSVPPKILMVLNDKAWFWSHRLPLAEGIIKEGWNLTVAAAGVSDDPGFETKTIKAIDLKAHGKGFNLLTELQLLISIFKAIKAAQPDLIHAITLRHAFYTGLAARLSGDKQCIFTIAGLGSLFSAESKKAKIMRLLALPFFRFAFHHKNAHIIFQNPDDAKAFQDCGAADSARSTIIKGSGVDLNKFKETPLPEGPPVFLFSSRLIREKGLREYVQAARLVKQKHKNASFLVAGDTNNTNPNSHTEDEVQAWHDDGSIEWLGHVDDMPTMLQGCHVFVLPSYYREGVPKVVLEAMATGRPIITTNMPGCRETVEDGINGFLVPPKDARALADQMNHILDDKDRLAAMGTASRAKAQAEFGVDSVVKRTLDVYKSCLNLIADKVRLVA